MTDEVHLVQKICLSGLGDVAVLSDAQNQQQSIKMNKQVNMFQTREQDKFQETNLNEIEISDLPDRIQNNSHKDAPQGQEINA